jgi:hypothetical protein
METEVGSISRETQDTSTASAVKSILRQSGVLLEDWVPLDQVD